MFTDIYMAFVIAMLFKALSLSSKTLAKLLIFMSCLTLIITYFVNGCSIYFIGEIDLAIWILCVIVFDALITFIEALLVSLVKKTPGESSYEHSIN